MLAAIPGSVGPVNRDPGVPWKNSTGTPSGSPVSTMASWRPSCSVRTRSRPAEAGPEVVISDRAERCGLLDLDEDALAGALLGRLDGGVLHVGGHVGQALGAARVGEDLVALLDVGQPVVEQ